MRKTDVTKLLDQLIQLDQETSRAYYEMGQILDSIKKGRLWEILGYDSFAHLVEEELSYSLTTAHRYSQTYAHFRRLKYTKTEALNLMYEYGYTNVSDYIFTAKDKVAARTVGKRIEAMQANRHQINFYLQDDDYRELMAALKREGAEMKEERLMHSSSALMRLVKKAKRVGNLKLVA